MRMAFGLAGILITVGVIVLILNFAILPYNKTVIHEGKKAQQQAEQVAGVDETGMRAMDSIKLEPESSGGRTESLLVTQLTAGGPMEKYFGLKRNDSIVEINGMKVRDWNDAETAEGQALEAYNRSGTLTVIRDGQRITLPQKAVAGANAAGTGAQPAGQAQQPAQPGQTGGSLQSQLDQIQKIGTH